MQPAALFRFSPPLIAALAGLSLSAAPALAQPNGVGTPFELAYWQAVATSDDPAAYDAYLAQYPEGTFAAIAALKSAALRAPAVPALEGPAAPVEAELAVAEAPAHELTAAVLTEVALVDEASAERALQETAASSPAFEAELVEPAIAVDPSAAPAPKFAEAGPGGAELAAAAPTSEPELAPRPWSAAATPTRRAEARTRMVARVAAIDNPTTEPAEPAAPAYRLPPQPRLARVPAVSIPASFCSAMERNIFHDDVYRPARRVAQDNNRAAIGHLRELQELYDEHAAQRDLDAMDAVAAAAQDYELVADASYDVTVDYDDVFDRLMAVRITDCGANQ